MSEDTIKKYEEDVVPDRTPHFPDGMLNDSSYHVLDVNDDDLDIDDVIPQEERQDFINSKDKPEYNNGFYWIYIIRDAAQRLDTTSVIGVGHSDKGIELSNYAYGSYVGDCHRSLDIFPI